MLSRSLAMAVAVALWLAAPLASPGDARAAAEETITSEPLRIMTIRVAPGAAAAVVGAIAQRARAEGYAVRSGAGPDGPLLALYTMMMAVHVLATPAEGDRLQLLAYDGTIGASPSELERWDRAIADLCLSPRIVGCETTVSVPSSRPRWDPDLPPPFFRARIGAAPGMGDRVVEAMAAYAEAHDLATAYGAGHTVNLFGDRLSAFGMVFRTEGDDVILFSVLGGHRCRPRARSRPSSTGCAGCCAGWTRWG